MKYTFSKLAVVIVALGTLSACSQATGTGSKYEPGPVGVGASVKELKGTPCACLEIPMHLPTDAAYGQGLYGA